MRQALPATHDLLTVSDAHVSLGMSVCGIECDSIKETRAIYRIIGRLSACSSTGAYAST